MAEANKREEKTALKRLSLVQSQDRLSNRVGKAADDLSLDQFRVGIVGKLEVLLREGSCASSASHMQVFR